MITNYSGTTLYWSGGIGPMNITQETTSIPFNNLIAVSLSSVSRSLNMEETLPKIIEELKVEQ
jgi:hypothetical protein